MCQIHVGHRLLMKQKKIRHRSHEHTYPLFLSTRNIISIVDTNTCSKAELQSVYVKPLSGTWWHSWIIRRVNTLRSAVCAKVVQLLRDVYSTCILLTRLSTALFYCIVYCSKCSSFGAHVNKLMNY